MSKIKRTPTIIRAQKDKYNPYVMINKGCLNDDRLSWQAKGLLAHLLSKPDDWEIKMEELVYRATNGEDSLKKIFRELEKTGYLIRKRLRNEKGVFTKLLIEVHELPIQTPSPQAENPLVDFPLVEKPPVEKPGLLINNYNNNNPIVPQEWDEPVSESLACQANTNSKSCLDKQEPVPKLTPRQQGTNQRALGTNPRALAANPHEDAFCQWWESYPKKVAKDPAKRAFPRALKIIELEKLLELTKVYAQKVSGELEKHILNPTTFLNQKRWEDVDRPPKETLSSEIMRPEEISINAHSEVDRRFKLAFLREIGVAPYQSWVHESKLYVELENGTLRLKGCSKFVEDSIKQKFSEEFERASQEALSG